MAARLILPALAAGALLGGIAVAQSRSEVETLVLAKREAAESLRRSQALERQADTATDEAEKASAAAAAVAARIAAAESDITAAETRIRIVETLRAEQRARLAERQQPVVHMTAALQTMARRPPALALVQPGSIDDVVRVRSLLASTLPVIRSRTAMLRREMAISDRLRRQAETAYASLLAGRQELKTQRLAFARLEVRERERSQRLADSALAQADRALAFTEEARDLTALIGSRGYQEHLSAALAALPGPILRPNTPVRPPHAASAAPRYRLPVEGRLVTGMGEISDAGVHARGLTFETAGETPVIVPRAGHVVYAGPFRSYGTVVIIDHGGGWSTLLANLGGTSVRKGDRVNMNDPLGRTRAGRSQVLVELRRHGRPFPITPLVSTT